MQVAARRKVDRGNALFEYLWRFWGVSCWHTLHEHAPLYQLYLCEARKESSALLRCLPTKPADLNALIFRIESRPSSRHQLEEIEQVMCDNLIAADLAKTFQEEMMKKVLVFNFH